MNGFLDKIEQCFGMDRVPAKAELVEHDGFDELEKASAREVFGDESWESIYQYLIEGEYPWGIGQLEEWSVLKPTALRYYLQAYLSYLLHTLQEPNPNEQFISQLFFELSEVLRIRGGGVFDDHQMECLREVSATVLTTIENDNRFEIWQKDIKENIGKCQPFLKATG